MWFTYESDFNTISDSIEELTVIPEEYDVKTVEKVFEKVFTL